MLDSIYHIRLKSFCKHAFGIKMPNIHDMVMSAISLCYQNLVHRF